jgi:hypothetical protein
VLTEAVAKYKGTTTGGRKPPKLLEPVFPQDPLRGSLNILQAGLVHPVAAEVTSAGVKPKAQIIERILVKQGAEKFRLAQEKFAHLDVLKKRIIADKTKIKFYILNTEDVTIAKKQYNRFLNQKVLDKKKFNKLNLQSRRRTKQQVSASTGLNINLEPTSKDSPPLPIINHNTNKVPPKSKITPAILTELDRAKELKRLHNQEKMEIRWRKKEEDASVAVAEVNAEKKRLLKLEARLRHEAKVNQKGQQLNFTQGLLAKKSDYRAMLKQRQKKRLFTYKYSLVRGDFKKGTFSQYLDSISLYYNVGLFMYYILLYDRLLTLRGWRHFKGIPVKSQRTRSNSWSSFKNNSFLRHIKLIIGKKRYGLFPDNLIMTAIAAEYYNSLWLRQWRWEWDFHKEKLKRLQKRGHGQYKIDIFSLSKGRFSGNNRAAKQGQKKKVYNKNAFTLGFKPGFTLELIKYVSNDNIETELGQRLQILFNKETTKSKKKKTKTKKKYKDVKRQQKEKKVKNKSYILKKEIKRMVQNRKSKHFLNKK